MTTSCPAAKRLATARPGDVAIDAVSLMSRRHMEQLPIIDGGDVAGLLGREDVVEWLASFGRGGVRHMFPSVAGELRLALATSTSLPRREPARACHRLRIRTCVAAPASIQAQKVRVVLAILKRAGDVFDASCTLIVRFV